MANDTWPRDRRSTLVDKQTGVPNEPLFKNNRSSPFLSLAGIPSQQSFCLLV